MSRISLFFVFCFAAVAVHGQTKLFPVIKSTGPVFDTPYAVDKPDPNQSYKIIASIGDENEKPGELHPALFHFARMYNLHAYSEIPKDKMDFVLIIYFKATPMALNNEGYKQKYSVDNPNLVAIEELKNAGVKVLVCSQSIEILQLDYRKVVPSIKIATSRFTTMSSYMLKGYAAFSL